MCNGIRYHVKLSAETYKEIKKMTALTDARSISNAIETAVAEIYDEYFPKIESAWKNFKIFIKNSVQKNFSLKNSHNYFK